MMIDPLPASVEREIAALKRVTELENQMSDLLKALGSVDDMLSIGWHQKALDHLRMAIAKVGK